MKTLVAFANSVPPDREAVLFIGVKDDGKVTGVANAANDQKDVQTWARELCYPSIGVQCELLDGLAANPVVAVVVSSSNNRPHFGGPAFVREANKSVRASDTLFDELVASRNEKAGAILRHKGEVVTVLFQVPPQTPPDAFHRFTIYKKESLDAVIKTCTALYVELELVDTGKIHSIPLTYVTLATDPTQLGRPKLIVDGQYRMI